MTKEIPVWTNDQTAPTTGGGADDVTMKLYSSTQPAVVQVLADEKAGSGFFASDKGDVVTDAHVVAGTAIQEIVLSSGQHLPARVTKIDDLHDLAILHVDNANVGTHSFLKLGSLKDLQVQSRIWALGHPQGLPEEYISVGRFTGTKSLREICHGVALPISGGTQEERRDAPKTSLGDSTLQTAPGSSGGAIVDASGTVFGVTDRGGGEITAFTPAEAVRTLLDSPSKYNISYGHTGFGDSVKSFSKSPTDLALDLGKELIPAATTYFAASTIGEAKNKMPVSALRRGAEIAGSVGVAAVMGASAYIDWNHLINKKETSLRHKIYYSTSLGADCVGFAGAVSSLIPSFSEYGKLGMKIGVAGMFGNYAFLRPAMDDFGQAMNSDLPSGDRIASGLSAICDTIGAAGTVALLAGKINNRIGLAALGIGAVGHYLPDLLPIHQTMTVSRANGDRTAMIKTY